MNARSLFPIGLLALAGCQADTMVFPAPVPQDVILGAWPRNWAPRLVTDSPQFRRNVTEYYTYDSLNRCSTVTYGEQGPHSVHRILTYTDTSITAIAYDRTGRSLRDTILGTCVNNQLTQVYRTSWISSVTDTIANRTVSTIHYGPDRIVRLIDHTFFRLNTQGAARFNFINIGGIVIDYEVENKRIVNRIVSVRSASWDARTTHDAIVYQENDSSLCNRLIEEKLIDGVYINYGQGNPIEIRSDHGQQNQVVFKYSTSYTDDDRIEEIKTFYPGINGPVIVKRYSY